MGQPLSFFRESSETEATVKSVHVYVEHQIEFDIPVADNSLTCGWLLTETIKRYRALKTKGKRKRIVALKSSDQSEGLDVYLLHPENSLEPLFDGIFLIAHLQKLTPDEKVSINSFE
jgi:hypothetical protein